MTIDQCFDETTDQFPVGMRVLAVDDDPICLRLLETLLRKCLYHVTTTNQAIKALKMLRENKNKFDLVISDVHMPDMDGFKLLELVGLEMDLPVIMLSANGDTKLVMKGITHGACDYLLKPVRIEELKNIWQHVVRRRKFDSKDQNNSDKSQHECEEGQRLTDSDQSGELNRKRKDQNEDEDEDHLDNSNEDPSTQKKPRVVWTVDLHRKFVAAVNQLGIDKAVPKRILDLMNVEKLTRENVASHLQKYRLYLKRISCVASQQANMVAALGGPDSAYLRMSSLNGFGNFHSTAGSAQFQNAAVASFSSSGMLGRLNSPAGLSMCGLSSSGMVQLGHAENLNNPITNQRKFDPYVLPWNQNGNILQGTSTSLEFDQVQHNKGVDHIGDLSTANNESIAFSISGDFSDGNINGSGTSNSLLAVPYNPMMLQGHPQEIERRGIYGNQSCATSAASNTEFPSLMPEFARCSNGWPAVPSSEIQSNSFPLSDCFKQPPLIDFGHNMSSISMDAYAGNSSCGISSTSAIPAGFPGLRTDLQCQAAPGLGSNADQNMKYNPKLGWNDASDNPDLICSSMSSAISPHVLEPFSQRLDPNNTVCNINNDFNMTGQPNLVDPLTMQHNDVERSTMETTVNLKQGYILDQRHPQDSYSYNNVGSLEDLVSAMMKQEQDYLGCETHSLGTCM